MANGPIAVLALLFVGHALADYPLQGDFLARAKVRGGIPEIPWGWALASHAAIHGGAVGIVTGSVALGIAEAIAHAAIDAANTCSEHHSGIETADIKSARYAASWCGCCDTPGGCGSWCDYSSVAVVELVSGEFAVIEEDSDTTGHG